jgi:SOS response regulatory protein OraA/RecX
MQTLVIDTYKIITRLQQKGFTKDQAEALVSAAQEINLSGLATKEYVGEKINQQTWQLVFFMAAQAALIVALIKLFHKTMVISIELDRQAIIKNIERRGYSRSQAETVVNVLEELAAQSPDAHS